MTERANSKWSVRRVAYVLLALVLLLGVIDGCGPRTKSGEEGGSETHFLQSCSGSCPDGLSCICGVCSRACSADDACAALSGQSRCLDACGEEDVPKRCDLACSTMADCSSLGTDFECRSGRCRQKFSVSSCQADPNPKPTLPLPGSLDADSVARAAIVMGSCLPDDGVDRNADHIWSAPRGIQDLTSRSAVQLACLANSNCGCAAAEHCWGWQVRAVSSCTPGCNGDTFTACGPGLDLEAGYAISVDCARLGLDCIENAFCAEAPTVTTTTCEEGTFVGACSAEGRPEWCVDGVVRNGPICAELGFDCVAGACVGRGASCAGSDFPARDSIDIVGTACVAAGLQACVGGALATIDCAAVGQGFTCQQVGSSFFCGLGSECEPATAGSRSASDPPSCNENILSFCNAGRLERVDCLELGFTGCGQDGQAHCTPSYLP